MHTRDGPTAQQFMLGPLPLPVGTSARMQMQSRCWLYSRTAVRPATSAGVAGGMRRYNAHLTSQTAMRRRLVYIGLHGRVSGLVPLSQPPAWGGRKSLRRPSHGRPDLPVPTQNGPRSCALHTDMGEQLPRQE